jgi:hypothetical protein
MYEMDCVSVLLLIYGVNDIENNTWKFPAVHKMQALAPTTAVYDPTAQLAQVEYPRSAKVPAPQRVQAEAPAVGWNCPAPQPRQALEPVAAEEVPAPQLEQTLEKEVE